MKLTWIKVEEFPMTFWGTSPEEPWFIIIKMEEGYTASYKDKETGEIKPLNDFKLFKTLEEAKEACEQYFS